MKTTHLILIALAVSVTFTSSVFAQSKDPSTQKTKKTTMPAKSTKAGKSTSLTPASTGSTPTSNDIHTTATRPLTSKVPGTTPATPPQSTIAPGKKERSTNGGKKKTPVAKNMKAVKDQ